MNAMNVVYSFSDCDDMIMKNVRNEFCVYEDKKLKICCCENYKLVKHELMNLI